ncbi:bardet-Biedl syndrome 5 protein [Trypanosoma grayi]|uniref:bardet-Biedl syndrome 5 protein n=1 Tax=Trypanosoma grayi TaxID=71804 RepID=UPI0004F42013|nr:bardet-Biedl syndrome 5 protein [Trypanosoma grayi]KEG10436.1 bardet-Biedl syndrome 5 protein [Trypanosoma grayi]
MPASAPPSSSSSSFSLSSAAGSAAATTASVEKAFTFWFDREVRFDVPAEELEVQSARGETLLSTLRPVEDTKGNNGEEGVFFVTNLRCMWHSARNRRKNLTIGYNGVQGVDVRRATSRLRGNTEALYISARFSSSRFEFVFTHLAQNLRLFATVPAVWRAYESSTVYRELRLRSSVIRDGELVLLPEERLFTRQGGVSNVSNDQGYIGTFFITNVRIAWCAQHAPNLNVSIPYLHFIGLHMRATKFGRALVLETSRFAGSYILGFRIDPMARLQELFKECVALWKAWTARPILGVAVVLQDIPHDAGDGDPARRSTRNHHHRDGDEQEQNPSAPQPMAPQPRVLDGENVVKEVATDAFAAYYVDVGQKGADRRPVFNTSIGLAVEKLRGGVALRDLWAVTT